MSKEPLSFVAPTTKERLLEVDEEMEFGEPFATFSWKRWMEIQASMMQCFTRFQRAIEHEQPLISHAIVRELHEMVLEIQREADEWIGTQ